MKINTDKEVKILKDGGIGIFPTDTAFGIGCRIDREDSIHRLFETRRRREDKAVPVLVSSIEMAQEYLMPIPSEVRIKLMERFWPGGLTIILPSIYEKVPDLVRGGGNTIGVRVPNHPLTRELIEKVGVPILGPSANFSGEKTPFYTKDLDPKLVELVDFVLEGTCSVREASTVIECSHTPWKIVREGAVKINI